MKIRDILVHMDANPNCRRRLDAAVGLAAEHDAHLIGLYVIAEPKFPGYVEVELPVDLLKIQEEQIAAAAAETEKTFNEVSGAAGITAEWRCVDGDPADMLTDQARYVDLIILGQDEHNAGMGGAVSDIPDHVVLTAGRPVMVIPENFAGGDIGKRVMIGWDGGQMATRAVHDALPILEKADEVAVMIVNPKDRRRGNGDLPGADVAHHLARHGVHAKADHVTTTDVSVGDQLLSRAADMRADLLVTGAYGHARWKELILGGVTRQLLDSMPVPVLMSH